MTLAAPACAAPWTALAPMPPMPWMITVSPGWTSPVFTAEPQPVPTEQPSRQATSSLVSCGTLIAESTATVVYSVKVEMPHIWPTAVPSSSCRRVDGSSQRVPASRPAPRSQRFEWPVAHQRHLPQAGRKEKTTLSPTSKPLVFGPTDSTMPPPS